MTLNTLPMRATLPIMMCWVLLGCASVFSVQHALAREYSTECDCTVYLVSNSLEGMTIDNQHARVDVANSPTRDGKAPIAPFGSPKRTEYGSDIQNIFDCSTAQIGCVYLEGPSIRLAMMLGKTDEAYVVGDTRFQIDAVVPIPHAGNERVWVVSRFNAKNEWLGRFTFSERAGVLGFSGHKGDGWMYLAQGQGLLSPGGFPRGR
jgi:hypothetical protein